MIRWQNKITLLSLDYNIGASEREEYEEKQKKMRKASSSFRECDAVGVGCTEIKFSCV